MSGFTPGQTLTADELNAAFAATAPPAAPLLGGTGTTFTIVNLGTGLALSGGTLSATSAGSVTQVIAQGGPFLANGTVSTTGTISNSVTSLTANALLLGAGASPVAPLASLGTSTTVLHGNAGGAPSFSAVDMANDVTGTLPVSHGGIGITSGLSGGVLAFTSTGGVSSSAPLAANHIVIGGGAGLTPATIGGLGNSGQALISAGAGNPPAFGALNLGGVGSVSGLLPFANIATLAADSLAGNPTGSGGAITGVGIGAGLALSGGSLVATGTAASNLVVTDGTTTINPTATVTFTGATVANLSGGNAGVTISGGGGGVSSIVFNNGLSGGTITNTGTVGLSTINPTAVLANSSTLGAPPVSTQVSSSLGFISGSLSINTITASSLFGNAGTASAVPGAIAVGTGLSLSVTGTLVSTSSGGSVTSVIAQGGPFLANGTITNAGTIVNSSASLAAHGVLIGEGTSAVVATAAMTNGQLLIGATGADPAPQTVSGDATINAGGTITVTKASGTVIPTAAGLGINISSGTISAHSQITVVATAGVNAITPTAAMTSVLVQGPSAGGSCTLTIGAATGLDQVIRVNISQGATAATWTLGTGFSFGTSGGPTSYTATAVAAQRDVIGVICNIGTVFDVMAIAQGFTA